MDRLVAGCAAWDAWALAQRRRPCAPLRLSVHVRHTGLAALQSVLREALAAVDVEVDVYDEGDAVYGHQRGRASEMVVESFGAPTVVTVLSGALGVMPSLDEDEVAWVELTAECGELRVPYAWEPVSVAGNEITWEARLA